MHHSLTACAQTNCSRNAIPRSRYRSDIGPYLHVVIASLQPCSYAPDDYSCHSALRFPDVPPRCRTIHCLPIAVLLQGHAVIILARDHLFVHERGDGVGVNGRSTTTQHNTTQHNNKKRRTTQQNNMTTTPPRRMRMASSSLAVTQSMHVYVVALRTNLMDGWPPPERRPSID